MYPSTLRGYVEAMGGSLEIQAIFPQGAVRVDILSGKQGSVGMSGQPGWHLAGSLAPAHDAAHLDLVASLLQGPTSTR